MTSGGGVRPEHPRPDWTRSIPKWVNLNGEWNFAFDDKDVGLQEGWWKWNGEASQQTAFDRECYSFCPSIVVTKAHLSPGKIIVPFAHQTELSGVYDRQPHEVGETICRYYDADAERGSLSL
jgi:hypothetical protein